MNFVTANKKMILVILLSMVGFPLLAQDSSGMVATGRTLNDVRVEIVSIDEEGKGLMRITGQHCKYCDREFWFDEITRMRTADYYGSIDEALMRDMIFVRGSVRAILADNWVQEVRYVEVVE